VSRPKGSIAQAWARLSDPQLSPVQGRIFFAMRARQGIFQ
jgi:hypothetical protein